MILKVNVHSKFHNHIKLPLSKVNFQYPQQFTQYTNPQQFELKLNEKSLAISLKTLLVK